MLTGCTKPILENYHNELKWAKRLRKNKFKRDFYSTTKNYYGFILLGFQIQLNLFTKKMFQVSS